MVGGTGLYSRAVVENFDFKDPQKIQARKYDVLQIALMPPKEWLEVRIAARNSERFQQGMIAELEKLLGQGVCEKWLRGLGYEYKLNLRLMYGAPPEEYWRDFSIQSMQYAKRQRTWFKKEKHTIFLEDPSKFLDECISLVNKWLSPTP